MDGVNSVTLLGVVVGEAPELRHTNSGTPTTGLLVMTKYRDQKPIHRVSLWGQTAEYTASYVRPGDWVEIQGRLIYRQEKNSDKVSAEVFGYALSGPLREINHGDRFNR